MDSSGARSEEFDGFGDGVGDMLVPWRVGRLRKLGFRATDCKLNVSTGRLFVAGLLHM